MQDIESPNWPFSDDEETEVYSTCIECNQRKLDPEEFYDGLRCIECCEREEAEMEREQEEW